MYKRWSWLTSAGSRVENSSGFVRDRPTSLAKCEVLMNAILLRSALHLWKLAHTHQQHMLCKSCFSALTISALTVDSLKWFSSVVWSSRPAFINWICYSTHELNNAHIHTKITKINSCIEYKDDSSLVIHCVSWHTEPSNHSAVSFTAAVGDTFKCLPSIYNLLEHKCH